MGFALRYKLLIALLSGLLFALAMGFVDENWFQPKVFLFAFVFYGAFFGFGFLYVMGQMIQFMAKKIKVELEEGEQLLNQTAANHFKKATNRNEKDQGNNGRLVLTNRRLVFKSHKSDEPQIASVLEDIISVESNSLSKVFPKGLSIKLKSGEDRSFIWYANTDWVKQIEELLH